MESVKKCKNFLVTLIKLASSDSRSANMANNVRGLVMRLLVRVTSSPPEELSLSRIVEKMILFCSCIKFIWNFSFSFCLFSFALNIIFYVKQIY